MLASWGNSPNHPTYPYVFSRHVLAVFESNATMRAVPFCVRVRSLLQEANIAPRDIARASHTRLPPWQLATPVTDLSLSHLQKSVVLPAELSSKALELIASFSNRQHIYTDGSKSGRRCGLRFCVWLRDTYFYSVASSHRFYRWTFSNIQGLVFYRGERWYLSRDFYGLAQ